MKTVALLAILGAALGNADVGTIAEVEAASGLLNAGYENCACLAMPDPGYCPQRLTRYYFDKVHGTCKSFFYGGCEGNSNNYLSAAECMANCAPTSEYEVQCLAPPDTKPCLGADTQAWAYYSTEGVCKEFTFGGCNSNDNKYPTKQACEANCILNHDNNQTDSLLLRDRYISPMAYSRTFFGARNHSLCNLPKEIGACFGHIPRFYYNSTTKTCQQFIYSGCRGNGNNFDKFELCQHACEKDVEENAILWPHHTLAWETNTPSSVCSLEKDVGPCKAYERRFYYNRETRTCELFIYGGCQGNRNNFMSRWECFETCNPTLVVIPRA